MCRFLAALALLLVVGCVSNPQPPPAGDYPDADSNSKTAPQSAAQPAKGALSIHVEQEPQSWVQFGILVRVIPTQLPSTEGQEEEAMRLQILLDSGVTLLLTQAISQAGKLAEGDRVRVLQIGDFVRVTFWPYGNFSAPGSKQ